MSTIIRKAGPEEASHVHAVMIDAFEVYRHAIPPTSAHNETVESVRREMEQGEEAALCLRDGRVVGSVRFSCRDRLYFHRLAVLRSEQRKGIGTAMLRWLEKEASLRGAETIWLKVRASVPQNVAFYRRHGYCVFDQKEEVNPNGDLVTIVSMRKDISR